MGAKAGSGRGHAPTAIRVRIWKSMRILRRFTVADLCRTAESKINNTIKFVRILTRHGIIAELPGYRGGRPGDAKSWRLVRDLGPDYPVVCPRCGNRLADPCEIKAVPHDK